MSTPNATIDEIPIDEMQLPPEELDEETRKIVMNKVGNNFEFNQNATRKKSSRKKSTSKNDQDTLIFQNVSVKKRHFNPRPLPSNWNGEIIEETKIEPMPSLLRKPININKPLAQKLWSKLIT